MRGNVNRRRKKYYYTVHVLEIDIKGGNVDLMILSKGMCTRSRGKTRLRKEKIS